MAFKVPTIFEAVIVPFLLTTYSAPSSYPRVERER